MNLPLDEDDKRRVNEKAKWQPIVEVELLEK